MKVVDAMREKSKCCKNCKWSDTDEISDRYCCNDESDYCANFVEDDFVCEKYE